MMVIKLGKIKIIQSGMGIALPIQTGSSTEAVCTLKMSLPPLIQLELLKLEKSWTNKGVLIFVMFVQDMQNSNGQ